MGTIEDSLLGGTVQTVPGRLKFNDLAIKYRDFYDKKRVDPKQALAKAVVWFVHLANCLLVGKREYVSRMKGSVCLPSTAVVILTINRFYIWKCRKISVRF